MEKSIYLLLYLRTKPSKFYSQTILRDMLKHLLLQLVTTLRKLVLGVFCDLSSYTSNLSSLLQIPALTVFQHHQKGKQLFHEVQNRKMAHGQADRHTSTHLPKVSTFYFSFMSLFRVLKVSSMEFILTVARRVNNSKLIPQLQKALNLCFSIDPKLLSIILYDRSKQHLNV